LAAAARALALIAWVAALGLAPGAATAHRTSLTRLELDAGPGAVELRLALSVHDLAVALGIPTDLKTPIPAARFERDRPRLEDYLGRRLSLAAGESRCEQSPPRLRELPAAGMLEVALRFACPQVSGPVTLRYLVFLDIDRAHRAVGVLRAGGAEEEFLLDREYTAFDFELAAPPPAGGGARRFLRTLALGVEHILLGYDHLLFLLALLLVVGRLGPLVAVVTAFTLAHSLTLALAWYGVVTLPPRVVEPLIAASIGYVAIENLLGRGHGHRWMLAGAFGLIHGLGFYSALSALGIARGHALATLVGFNLGVEAGQLAVVALVYGPLRWWTRRPWYRRSMAAASALILSIASWWVVERTLLA